MRPSPIAVALVLAAATPLPAQIVAPQPRPASRDATMVRSGQLTLDQVLASARLHAPQALEALARVRMAEGRRLSVEGAFDTLFSAEGVSRLTGYYDGTYLGAKLSRPLPTNGGALYGGYRVSRGAFPIYEDEQFTKELGEAKAGLVFALLRDRLIDERRFGRTQADIELQLADAERLMIAIGVQSRAIQAYNAWVIAGLRLRVYRELLDLAEQRQRGFARQVAAGYRPRILLVESEQNILRRQKLVTQTEQALEVAANALSLFWRDADGRPLVPLVAQLPDALPSPPSVPIDPRSAALQRPDVQTIELRLNLIRQRLTLERNNLLPRLDVAVEVSRDFGDEGLAGFTRNGTDTKVGLTFTVPLQNRAARGRLLQSRAEIEAVARRGQVLSEQIGVQIDTIAVNVHAARRLAELTQAERERAETMAAAERRRFQMGASDFFLVNLREEAAADAAVLSIDAEARQIEAAVELLAVTADTTALGL